MSQAALSNRLDRPVDEAIDHVLGPGLPLTETEPRVNAIGRVVLARAAVVRIEQPAENRWGTTPPPQEAQEVPHPRKVRSPEPVEQGDGRAQVRDVVHPVVEGFGYESRFVWYHRSAISERRAQPEEHWQASNQIGALQPQFHVIRSPSYRRHHGHRSV